MSRFYYGCVSIITEERKSGVVGTRQVKTERNFIYDKHPALVTRSQKITAVVITFYQEISEDMYVLLNEQGHFHLNEISATDTI